MSLFDTLPDNFFSPLSSANKRIYLKALFVLHKRFKNDWRIKKDELVYVLADALSSDASYFSFSEEGEEEDRSYSGFAHMLLRKLETTGWVEYEYGETSFDLYVIIPEYAIMILETLKAIEEGDSVEYNSYVYSTYSSLRLAEDTGSDHYHALVTAHERTQELMTKLKILLNNIKRFQRRLADHEAVQALVREHFDEFKAGISDRIYHPLKTFDSVPRFKTPILSILNRWLTEDAVLEAILQDGLKRGRFEADGFTQVITMISDIIEVYEKINALLGIIDVKHAAYTRAAVERIEYMLNVDGSTRSRLVKVLQRIGQYDEDSYKMPISTVMNLREDSLYIRKKQAARVPAPVLTLAEDMDDTSLAKEMDGMKAVINSAYSNQQILAYIEALLKDRDTVAIQEIDLEEDADYIRMILASLQHDDRKSTYTVTYEGGKVSKGAYQVPGLTIRKKVK